MGCSSFVSEVRGEPPFHGGGVHPLPAGIVPYLVPPDAADAEVPGPGMPEVVTADRGGRLHREALCQRDAGAPGRVEQLEDRGLLAVVRASGIAGRRTDALVALADQLVV